MNNSMVNVLAVHSYGYINGPEDMGSGAVGSRARLLYAAMLVDAGVIPRENLIAVFTQGWHPQTQGRGTKRPLCDMMAEYLQSRPEMSGVQVITRPMGWGTLANICDVYALVVAEGYTNVHLHSVSDSSHIKRVLDTAERTKPKHWKMSYYGASFHRMTWRERWIREPAARLQYRFRLRQLGW